MAEKTIDRCPHCNKFTWRGAEFCHQCGGTLHSKTVAAAPTAAAQTTGDACKACGAALKPGFKFCGACGEPVPEKPSPSEMTGCYNCGTDIKKGTRFCPNCGNEIIAERPTEKACPKCGALMEADVVFCPKCGERIPLKENHEDLAERAAKKREAIERSVEGFERIITVAVASPKIIAVIAAILLIVSCFVPWLKFTSGVSLPAYLIVANICVALISVVLASRRRPIWGLFLLVGILVFTMEFTYLYGLQGREQFAWDVTLAYLNEISTGFVLHLIAGILLFINIYFARLRQQIEFERYVKSHARWEY